MKKIILAILAVVFLSTSCRNVIPSKELEGADPGRIKVVAAQTIRINSNWKAIVVLLDSKTGAEYLAVQGFGVVEINDGEEKSEEK